MKILDLFAGIGGFSLAAHWVGWETVAFVEWDKYCQKVLKKNFPNVPIYGDIKQFNGKEYAGSVDIICGGFPCQPFSTAGNRKGKDDDRYLWPEMLRVIREVRPTWVVGENVAGILSMDGGKVFEQICTSLEGEEYAVQAFIIPALAKGAPHRRDRVWIVANSNESTTGPSRTNTGAYRSGGINYDESSERGIKTEQHNGCDYFSKNNTSDPNKKRLERSKQRKAPGKEKRASQSITQSNQNDGLWGEHWYEVATRTCRVDDGVSKRVDGNKANRLKTIGNAIVPQVVYEIFQAIENEQTARAK